MRTCLFLAASIVFPALACASDGYDQLRVGDALSGFRATAIYLDETDKPMGARLVHERSGHTLDLLRIESVPQAYTWIGTMPVSDQGESHTQEHLLLLKGTMGRTLSTRQQMSLAGSTAFTQQWRTSYMFNTAAGADVFFDLYAEQLKAMLHPNYTDEEIRREVRNFGVTQNADGTLRLEERGPVYNEMVSSTANPFSRAFRAARHMVYGETHPLAYNAGGEPSGIRTMKPEDIRNFQRSTHHLANMGTIAAFPAAQPLAVLLRRFDAVLSAAEGDAKPRAAESLDNLPAPRAAPEGTIRIAEYPHRNERQPSPLLIVWPATRKLDADEELLADLLFANIASDATTNLYKAFIDSKTRKLDLGARSVSASVLDHGGHPIFITFTDVPPAQFSAERLQQVRALVIAELERIAAMADGSPELADFNARIANRLVQRKRDLVKFVETPPGFGFRGGSSRWMDHLRYLEKTTATSKSLTLKPQTAFVQGLLDSKRNIWREYLARWGVMGVTPYVAAARPSPALVQREEAERQQRLDEETARLKARYAIADAQEAIRRHRADADAAAAEIEAEAKKVAPIPFVASPPMTLDDALRYGVATLRNGVPLVASRFDGMASATVGIALRLEGIPKEELRYLSLLPALLRGVGVVENGKVVTYDEMTERLRREILTLDASISTNVRTGRVELVVRGSGIGEREAMRAVEWMGLVLRSPNLRKENLARIRDVVDQSLSQLRNTMQGAEEIWVNNPVNAYLMQRDPAFLAADSFLTREYNALRIRWMLKEVAPNDRQPLADFLGGLADAGRKLGRDELKALLAGGETPGLEALAPSVRAIANDALKDIDLELIQIPDGSLAADFAQLANGMREDLAAGPGEALARIDSLRRRLLKAAHARMFAVAAPGMHKTLRPRIEALAAQLQAGKNAVVQPSVAFVDARLRERDPAAAPRHVGLYSPNKQGGVIITLVPSAHYADFGDRERQLDYLASRLYSGYGSHGIFLTTLAAGLAYSNGLRGSLSQARTGYYAERTPELPQTVRFVVGELKSGQPNPSLGEYAVGQAFGEFRSAMTFEARAEGIAADLADGQPPQQVRKFRESILAVRKDPELVAKLFARKDHVYGRMLPGYGGKPGEVPGGVYFVIGPDKQLDAWDRYLRDTEGSRLHKLYGRDFWMK